MALAASSHCIWIRLVVHIYVRNKVVFVMFSRQKMSMMENTKLHYAACTLFRGRQGGTQTQRVCTRGPRQVPHSMCYTHTYAHTAAALITPQPSPLPQNTPHTPAPPPPLHRSAPLRRCGPPPARTSSDELRQFQFSSFSQSITYT